MSEEILELLKKLPYIYITVISAIAVIVTVYDKIASKKMRHHRTPESALLMISALGGSVFMYVVMLLTGHKTRHAIFMAGLPCMILVQVGIFFSALLLTGYYG